MAGPSLCAGSLNIRDPSISQGVSNFSLTPAGKAFVPTARN